MGEAISLGAVRRFRAAVSEIKRAHPNACSPSLDALSAQVENKGPMVKHIEKTCLGCGIPFIAGRRDKVFHSLECKNDWHQRRLAALKAPSEIEAALDVALRLTRARSPEAVEARRAVFALLSAEFTPTPIAAPANDHTDAGELAAAPALDAAEVLARLQRVREGDKRLTQKAIAEESGVDQSSLSRFITGARALGSDSLDALDRYLTEHERKVKPR